MDEKAYLEHLNRLWKKNWPAHLPREPIYPLGEILLTDYLREWAKVTPEKVCLIFYGRDLTFKDLNDLSDRFAALLASYNGFKRETGWRSFSPIVPSFSSLFMEFLNWAAFTYR